MKYILLSWKKKKKKIKENIRIYNKYTFSLNSVCLECSYAIFKPYDFISCNPGIHKIIAYVKKRKQILKKKHSGIGISKAANIV